MAIPSLVELKATVSAAEIAPFEKDITDFLETPNSVSYFASTQVGGHTVTRIFNGKTLTGPGIAALKASIEDADWTDVVVKNVVGPARPGIGGSTRAPEQSVEVTFKAPVSGG